MKKNDKWQDKLTTHAHNTEERDRWRGAGNAWCIIIIYNAVRYFHVYFNSNINEDKQSECYSHAD